MTNRLAKGIPSAGIFAGPLAFLADTQINYALVPWICAHQIRLVPVVALAMAAISLFGGYLSWRGWRAAPSGPASPVATAGGSPHRFVALIGIGMAALFAAVIVLHGTAGVVFHGCER